MYLKHTSRYTHVHALEILLKRIGWLEEDQGEHTAARIRSDDFYAALDSMIIESKIARRNGTQEDLGREDPGFEGIYISWVPTVVETPEGMRPAQGTPHVIRIERHGGVGQARTAGVDMSGLAVGHADAVWVSGQQIRRGSST